MFGKKKPRYIWRITLNHMSGNLCTITGPENADERLLEDVGETFELYDDDGELYFTGTIHGHFTGFEPLDDFGQPGYGCTEIRYDGKRL